MSLASIPKPKVIFATHAFQDARTGPAVYANYLWEAFREDPQIEFHLVSPDGPDTHPRSHRFGSVSTGSRNFYQALIITATRLARNLGPRGILHLNAPHYGHVPDSPGWATWLQLNDYEGAQLYRSIGTNLLENGARRFAALCVRRWRERRALRSCQLAMANSEYTRQQILAAYPEIPPQRIRTVYKSVNTEFFSGEKSHSPNPNGRKFVFVGSNIKIKRLHIAVQAFSLMDSPHSTLDIAGCEREEFVRQYPGLKKQVDDLRVTFHGRLPRLAVKELLLRSDVLLQPSRQEALGVALIEAIACGCRVLASNSGGMPEIVKGGHIGVLINDSTPHAWANAMIRELSFPGLDNNAKQEVLENFGTEKMIGMIRKLYKDNLS